MLTQRPRGTSDILPGVSEQWQRLEQAVRDTCRLYNFKEIRTPVFEHTELFARGVGETTDIVEKEMYTFTDRGDRSLTLRPEGTAGVVRAYVENKLFGSPDAVKMYYVGPMFRYEKPQKGRDRQFHQYGCEVFGSEDPGVDAEVIALNLHILDNLGVKGVTVELNSVGCSVCRPLHKKDMIERLLPVADRLCKDCQARLEKNPLRIFDCKNESCQALLKEVGAPTIAESLCDECQTHFSGVQGALDAMDVDYRLNPYLVRGLDYYTRTAWEYVVEGFSSIGGGGRYNGLVAQVGGPETPGIGFAGGMERVLMVLAEQSKEAVELPLLDLYVVGVDASGQLAAAKLLQQARKSGVSADRDYLQRSVKAQFKAADRLNARYVAVLGETEVAQGRVALKNLATGEQVDMTWADAILQVQQRGV
ncbi:histidine--tRNA ligase [Alicyclobacillus ferrooxydans]|uniref:Histidine--tRNA ligase n=1 Tax=Alicyclobacillus ferrooxydans TaxID=471514 RepID=A0A0P9ELP6_9BACL|nr:histidine--tRNA ligase [Alicyclobacillus ferrooxydans]KPV44219.1 histidyl-tRNA synthetase [Alicyclobacillus ferrooxydans]